MSAHIRVLADDVQKIRGTDERRMQMDISAGCTIRIQTREARIMVHKSLQDIVRVRAISAFMRQRNTHAIAQKRRGLLLVDRR
jgi:hypothetical protein